MESFFQACIEGRCDDVKSLLTSQLSLIKAFGKVHPDHRAFMQKENADDGWSALHLAAHYGQFAVVQLLVQNGADLNVKARNAIGNTPLMAAIAGGQKQIVAFLLQNGANTSLKDSSGFDAAGLAEAEGKFELVSLLKNDTSSKRG